jgi:NAD(P)-dependent dehydrogenase (short-subunit alcohol dehydrogenase family)
MARVLITGSTDGLGLGAARILAAGGHAVTLHARNASRAADARVAMPTADNVVIGELSTLDGIRQLATEANALGRYDAVIHNAAVGSRQTRLETVDGLEHVFVINVLAPYMLTELMIRPSRLIYLSSSMHEGGIAALSDPQWERRRWSGSQAYSDSKLFDVVLAFAYARRWPDVFSNVVDPGWVATKMGGPGASSDLPLGSATQAWLAASDDEAAKVTGHGFFHHKQSGVNPAARDIDFQLELLAYCGRISGVAPR